MQWRRCALPRPGADSTSARRAGLCFTSGTTGAPKGVTYTHRSSFLHTLRLLQADVMGIAADDSVLAVVPMFHANAWGLPFAVPAVGAKLVLPGRNTDGANLATLITAEARDGRRRRAHRLAGARRASRRRGGEVPYARADRGRRLAIAAGADGAHRAAPRRLRADELGHDRAVAVGHHVVAACAQAIGRNLGSPRDRRGSSADGCGRAASARAARRRRTSARARRQRDRALLRR